MPFVQELVLHKFYYYFRQKPLIHIYEPDEGSSPIPDNILEDGCWKEAVFHDLSTDSLYWNRASLVSISKRYAKGASTALIYLLQKEAHTLLLWKKEWDDAPPSPEQFVNSISAWGRFSNSSGRSIPPDDFWKKFTSIMEGITSEKSFQFSINGTPAAYCEVLKKEDLLQVICFDDTWAEQNYLIETPAGWVLYNWVSGA